MPRIVINDHDYSELALEQDVFAQRGIEMVVAQCRTEEDVIAAARGCFGILLQCAPITEKVVRALPGSCIVSRYGAGYDAVDTAACERNGVGLRAPMSCRCICRSTLKRAA
jgi:D-3-phosphoglycerate dehydrogenase